eukprot:scaffold42845_cov48-Cyclotella_meneghiniana.AAC.2
MDGNDERFGCCALVPSPRAVFEFCRWSETEIGDWACRMCKSDTTDDLISLSLDWVRSQRQSSKALLSTLNSAPTPKDAQRSSISRQLLIGQLSNGSMLC